VASLVWSANSALNAGDVKTILTSTASRNFGHYSAIQYGAGLIDAEASVRRAFALRYNGTVAGLYNHTGLFFT
jgi:hypothetical protein